MFDDQVRGLQETFGDLMTTQRGEAHHVRLASVPLPPGCTPDATPVLLVHQLGNRPIVYVKPVLKGPHGAPPRSCSDILIEGESWVQFSYQFPWDPEKDDLVKFVLTALQRFAKHE